MKQTIPEVNSFSTKAAKRDIFCWQTTVVAQKAEKIHVGGEKTKAEYFDFRSKQDVATTDVKTDHPIHSSHHASGQTADRRGR